MHNEAAEDQPATEPTAAEKFQPPSTAPASLRDAHSRWVSDVALTGGGLREEVVSLAEAVVMEAGTSQPLERNHEGFTQFSGATSLHPDGADFIASPAFIESRPGFVFKLGDRGLGYYLDKAPAPESAAPAPPQDFIERARELLAPEYSVRETDDRVTVVIATAHIDAATVATDLTPSGCEVRVHFYANGKNYAVRWSCSGAVQSISTDVSLDNLVVGLLKRAKGAWTAPAILGFAVSAEQLDRHLETNLGPCSASCWLSKLTGAQSRNGIFDLD